MALRRAKRRKRRDVLATALTRKLVAHYGRTAAGRIGTESVLSALGVLIRRHPGVALEMAAAGVLGAGRRSLEEIGTWRRQSRRDGPSEPEPGDVRPEGADAPRSHNLRKDAWTDTPSDRRRTFSKSDRRRLLGAIRKMETVSP